MPITFVQQGVIGQFLAAILMMLGSDGLLEVSAPMTDDERRDQEVHIRGLFGSGLALQIKTSTYLHLQPKALHPLLQVQFSVLAERVISHPNFWYLFAYLDRQKMAFGDPLFLVPSAFVHSHGYVKQVAGQWHFELQARMSATSNDRWAPWQVASHELGNRVLQIIRDAIQNPPAQELPANFGETPGLLYVAGRQNRQKAA